MNFEITKSLCIKSIFLNKVVAFDKTGVTISYTPNIGLWKGLFDVDNGIFVAQDPEHLEKVYAFDGLTGMRLDHLIGCPLITSPIQTMDSMIEKLYSVDSDGVMLKDKISSFIEADINKEEMFPDGFPRKTIRILEQNMNRIREKATNILEDPDNPNISLGFRDSEFEMKCTDIILDTVTNPDDTTDFYINFANYPISIKLSRGDIKHGYPVKHLILKSTTKAVPNYEKKIDYKEASRIVASLIKLPIPGTEKTLFERMEDFIRFSCEKDDD